MHGLVGILGHGLAVVLASMSAISGTTVGMGSQSESRSAPTIIVGPGSVGAPIPSGFVGLSFELPSLLSYAGPDPAAVDPVFAQLIRNLAPGQRPVLRIGGDSADWSWYPVAGMRAPPWVRYVLSPGWVAVARSLAAAVDARLILGVNLEANSRSVASAEAEALIDGIGRGSMDALELGNEPELYKSYNWYRDPDGDGVRGRGPGYGFSLYSREFAAIAAALPRIPLAGPSVGSAKWSRLLGPFLRANRSVAIATLHRYPLKRCRATAHRTAAELLSESSSIGLAASVAPYVRLATRLGDAVRIDEMNSISCGGQPGLSDTFASALWSLDALFAMARVGVVGVNIHTGPTGVNQPFAVAHLNGSWTARVHPIYYGMLMFAQATPPGSRLLQTSAAGGAIRVWATDAPDGRVRVILINTSRSGSETLAVRVPHAGGPASLERLLSPSLDAVSGVTLAGRTFDPETTTGEPVGVERSETAAPVSGAYLVELPAASAAMLTVPAPARAAERRSN
jgi:Glycosyl hydrolase family 79 C-terminal beta domain